MTDSSSALTVDLGERSYPIYIGAGLIDQPALFAPAIVGQQVLVVSNTTVAPLYMERVRSALAAFDCDAIELPDGEVYKNLDTVNLIFDRLLEKRFERSCTLVALGGGVVGDMTGFAAACYQRGVGFVQVPTTLLSQVDSSVGGKTGVNHPHGKNMIGAFYQPQAVIADTETLNTLEDRELSAGLAEVIKYGVIRDADFFVWLEANMAALRDRDPQALAYAIRRSCQNKAEIVAADELEAGQRSLLNLGHTFGHAIEAGMGYGNWLHGEAVAAGMVMAGDMAHRLGWFDAESVQRQRDLLARAGLPVEPPALGVDTYRGFMAIDKKVQAGRLRLVLPKAIGTAVVTDAFDAAALNATLAAAG